MPTLHDKLQLVEERPFVFPGPVGQLEDMERIMHHCLMDWIVNPTPACKPISVDGMGIQSILDLFTPLQLVMDLLNASVPKRRKMASKVTQVS